MKLDIEDIMFWMDAIRNSDDRYRTLESFWKGQIKSKVWLIENLEHHIDTEPKNVIIHGGWNGVLASLIFNSEINAIQITSLDVDPACEKIALTMNKRQEIEGRFTAVTADMCNYKYSADIVINTSCEHITQEQYEQWLRNVPDNAIVVLQSNDYFQLNEHVRCVNNNTEFLEQSKIKPLQVYEMRLPKYTRFMIIGKKNV